MDAPGVSALLRTLSPQQEKVIRLYFGLGCKRPHSAEEMAQEFGVSQQAIAGILGAAQRRLARQGLTSRHLREAAREQAERDALAPAPGKSACRLRLGGHSHRRV
jgi:AraC-like DNA-binding protein